MRFVVWLKKLELKFLRFLNGDGFTMPKPDPKTECMYNYCKAIANDSLVVEIDSYEKELKKWMDKHPGVERKECAEIYMEAIKIAFGKENV